MELKSSDQMPNSEIFQRESNVQLKRMESLFSAHEVAIQAAYGAIEKWFCVAELPKGLNDDLINFIIQKKPLDLEEEAKKANSEKYLYLSDIDQEYINRWEKAMSSWTLSPQSQVVKRVHNYIRMALRDYFRSPIAFVNSYAKLLNPHINQWGPTSLHMDNFVDGHLKVNIYPFGLSEEVGGLFIAKSKDDGENLHLPPGSIVAFKNSDAPHMAIPGKKLKRLNIEITVMRSFLPINQYNESSIFGRHLKSPAIAYDLAAKSLTYQNELIV